MPEGSGMRGAGSVVLTPAEPRRFGAVEYARIIQPAVRCACAVADILRISLYVWLGASASMPGEGLVISLVDARRQMPGKTVFKRGCGTRPALPEAAVSIVFDTGDSDPSCDEPGTGSRLVVSLEGGNAPPLVLSSSLDLSTTTFRSGAWIPLAIELYDNTLWIDHGTSEFVVTHVFVNGSDVLDPYMMLISEEPRIRAANLSLQSFYVVVSARTGGIGSDRHAVSGLRVERCPHVGIAGVENWSGFRQPFTPPPASPPWQPPPPPPPPPRAAAVRSAAQLGAVSFGVAFACTLVLLLAVLLHPRALSSRHAAMEAATVAKSDEECLVPPLPAKRVSEPPELPAESDFDVFLSYRRADALLVDSVHDKLRLAGLRVFRDVEGFLAGQPFDAHLVRIMRGTPVFAPVVTLASVQRLGGAATQCDAFLAELLVALCLHDASNIRLIHPLLVGRKTDGGWASLLEEPAYEAALAALPDAASAATVALVDAALHSAGAAPMPAHIAALTVRQVLLGRAAAPAVGGVLSGAPFALACSAADLDLHVSRQYAAPMWDAVRKRTAAALNS